MAKSVRTTKKLVTMPRALSVLLASHLMLSTSAAWAGDPLNSEMLQNGNLPVAPTFNVASDDLVKAAESSSKNSPVATTFGAPQPGLPPLTQVAVPATETKSESADTTKVSLGPIPYVPAQPKAPVAPTSPERAVYDEVAPIVIDNDEETEVQETIKYEEMPTDEGKTKIKAGARFPVVMQSELNSKNSKVGDPFQARLKYELKIGDKHIADKGSMVTGHLNYVLKARTLMGAMITVERFYRNSGVLGFEFDELINEKGEHIKLEAMPARQARIVKNKAEGRELGVNHRGQVVGPWSQQLRYKAVRVGLNFALAPAGVFTFGAMPVALGVIGAANPSFAFMKPVGLNVRHRRLKGFAWGFLSGIPGSFLIEDTTVRGQEAIIKPGDEFLAEMNQEFTGEPMTDADIVPNASTKVRGSIVKEKSKK